MTSIPPRPRTAHLVATKHEWHQGAVEYDAFTDHPVAVQMYCRICDEAIRIPSIEAEAAAVSAQDSRPLDVERLRRVFEEQRWSVLMPLDKVGAFWHQEGLDERPLQEKQAEFREKMWSAIAAEYARLAAEKPHD